MTRFERNAEISYSDAWLKYTRREAQLYGRPVERAVVEIIKAFDLGCIDEVIDIGCGAAGLLQTMLDTDLYFRKYIGLDREEELIRVSRLMSLDKHRFIQWDAENPTLLDLEEDTARVFTLIRVLNNISDMACANLLSCLKTRHDKSNLVIINPISDVVNSAYAASSQSVREALHSRQDLLEFEGANIVHYQRSVEQYLRAIRMLGYRSIKTKVLYLKGSVVPTHTAIFGII